MDSYNRGYDPGIAGLGGADTYIGNARLLNIPIPQGSESSGFYASAYTLGSETIISYRGTDNRDILGFDPGANDFWNSWLFGAGVPTSQLL
jgi:hypothetical protein